MNLMVMRGTSCLDSEYFHHKLLLPDAKKYRGSPESFDILPFLSKLQGSTASLCVMFILWLSPFYSWYKPGWTVIETVVLVSSAQPQSVCGKRLLDVASFTLRARACVRAHICFYCVFINKETTVGRRVREQDN